VRDLHPRLGGLAGAADPAAPEGPAARLARLGPGALTDRELVAIVLGAGLAEPDALALADRVLTCHGSPATLATLPPAALTAARGMGPVRAARLAAALELGRRRLPESAVSAPVSDEHAAGRIATALVGHERRETFGVLFLDTRNRLLAAETLFQGSLDAAPVYPREIATRALAIGAAAVILAHNHPSGVLEPSEADRRVTRRVGAALDLVDVEVHDHLIAAGDRYVSMRRLGAM